MVLHSSTYEIDKVIKLIKKIASKDSGISFMIIIIYLYQVIPVNYIIISLHYIKLRV